MVKVKEYQYEFSIDWSLFNGHDTSKVIIVQRKQWRRMNKIKKIFNYEGN
jgi:hypothetical protein